MLPHIIAAVRIGKEIFGGPFFAVDEKRTGGGRKSAPACNALVNYCTSSFLTIRKTITPVLTFPAPFSAAPSRTCEGCR